MRLPRRSQPRSLAVVARRATRWLAAVGVLLAVASPAGVASAAARWEGINDLSSVSGKLPFATSASLAAQAGVNSTRLVVDWSWIEPARGTYRWGILDGVYWADLAQGLRPLIGITGAPRWAWDPSATCPVTRFCAYPPGRAHATDYQDMIRRLTRRYPRAVGIEIGNEPNLGWAWAGGVSPARYMKLVRLAYGAVKSVDPAMPVLAGALAPVLTDARTPTSFGLRPFLDAMYAHGLRGHADGISIHPYPQTSDLSRSFEAISLARETETANGDSMPLWATELGATTTGPESFSVADQATLVPALIAALRSDPGIRGIYVHTLIDDPANPDPAERGYGLVGADLVPKPAYCGLAAVEHSTWSCPTPALTVRIPAPQSARWDAQTLLQAAAQAAIRYHATHGGYSGLTSGELHALDARVSARPAPSALAPGLTADPSRVGVYPGTSADWIVLCNSSRADRSYCISTVWRGAWTYGSAAGNINTAAGAAIKGISGSW